MEDEEGAAERGDVGSERVEMGFAERDAARDEFFFFEPLLEEEFVGCTGGDLVEWVVLSLVAHCRQRKKPRSRS